MNHKTSLVKIKALFGETFLAQQSLDFLGGSSLPEEIDLSYDYLQKLKENNFDVLYVPEVHGVTFTPDVIMGLWERCSPNTTILYNYDDVYKWYTSNKDSFWYKEILPTGWLFMKSVPLEGSGFSKYDEQTRKLEIFISTINSKNKKKNFYSEWGFLKFRKGNVDTNASLLAFDKKHRSSFVEEFLRLIISLRSKRKPALGDYYVWTSTLFEGREMVRIGFFDIHGADVTKRDSTDGNSMTQITPVLRC